MNISEYLASREPEARQLFSLVKPYLSFKTAESEELFEEQFVDNSTPYRDSLIRWALDFNPWFGPGFVVEALNRRGFICDLKSNGGNFELSGIGLAASDRNIAVLRCMPTRDDKTRLEELGVPCGKHISIPSSASDCKRLAVSILSIPFPVGGGLGEVVRRGARNGDEWRRAISDGRELSTSWLDIEVAPLVRVLNLVGVETSGSCGGHGLSNPEITIDEPTFTHQYSGLLGDLNLSYSGNQFSLASNQADLQSIPERLYLMARAIWERAQVDPERRFR